MYLLNEPIADSDTRSFGWERMRGSVLILDNAFAAARSRGLEIIVSGGNGGREVASNDWPWYVDDIRNVYLTFGRDLILTAS